MRKNIIWGTGLILSLVIGGCDSKTNPTAPSTPGTQVSQAECGKSIADLPALPLGINWNGPLQLTVKVHSKGDWRLDMYAGNSGSPEYTVSEAHVVLDCHGEDLLSVLYPWHSTDYQFWYFRLWLDGKQVWRSEVADKKNHVWF